MLLIINNYTTCEHLGAYEMADLGNKCKKISGLDFMVKHFSEVNSEFMEKNPQITGIIAGGCNCDWNNLYFDIFEGEFEVARSTKVPFLGICAGHQLIAMAYGSYARRVDFGREERFYCEMDVVKDSIFSDGIEGSPTFFEFHQCEVSELPEGFEVLMSNKKIPIQAMKKIDAPIYGCQFHPELYDDNHMDGYQVIKNFLDIVTGKSN